VVDNVRYRLIGANGSPYSLKMRALMRYRRLAFDWVMRTAEVRAELADLRPQLIPVLHYPDGSYHFDSTKLIFDLEDRHPAARSVIPDDPGQAFLALLIEDMADEWLTKAMFHYRWHYEASQDFASRWIANDSFSHLQGTARAEMAATMKARQIGRMHLVGCTPENKPVIEASYERVLDALNAALDSRRYLFGGRPSLAEFGLFGQLKVLADDPTPMAVMRGRAGNLVDWLRFLDDASGVTGDWQAPDAATGDGVTGLLALCGAAYLPFLAANSRALDNGDEAAELEIFGRPYRQPPFGYQAKCLAVLRAEFAKLGAAARARIDPLLEDAACLRYLV